MSDFVRLALRWKNAVIPDGAKRISGIRRGAPKPVDGSRSGAASPLVRDDAVVGSSRRRRVGRITP